MKKLLSTIAAALAVWTVTAQDQPAKPATQPEVNTGIITKKFVSPKTLAGWTGGSGGGLTNAASSTNNTFWNPTIKDKISPGSYLIYTNSAFRNQGVPGQSNAASLYLVVTNTGALQDIGFMKGPVSPGANHEFYGMSYFPNHTGTEGELIVGSQGSYALSWAPDSSASLGILQPNRSLQIGVIDSAGLGNLHNIYVQGTYNSWDQTNLGSSIPVSLLSGWTENGVRDYNKMTIWAHTIATNVTRLSFYDDWKVVTATNNHHHNFTTSVERFSLTTGTNGGAEVVGVLTASKIAAPAGSNLVLRASGVGTQIQTTNRIEISDDGAPFYNDTTILLSLVAFNRPILLSGYDGGSYRFGFPTAGGLTLGTSGKFGWGIAAGSADTTIARVSAGVVGVESLAATNGFLLPGSLARIQFTGVTASNPPTSGAGTAFLFGATNIIGGTAEIMAMDGAGNITTISPHATDAPASLYENVDGMIPHVSRTVNPYLGGAQWINESREARRVEQLLNCVQVLVGLVNTNGLNALQLFRLNQIANLTAAQKDIISTATNYVPQVSWTSTQNRLQSEYAARYTNAVVTYNAAVAGGSTNAVAPVWGPPAVQPIPAQLAARGVN